MSANIPFEIQRQIMKKAVVKSLIRFRSVSKQWKSLIDSSEFITDYSVNRSQPHHLLVMYRLLFYDKYVSIVDDDSNFPKRKFYHSLPSTVKLVTRALMLDSSHGLVCIWGLHQDPLKENNLVVLWNPTIRKSVCIELPFGLTAVGFGVCPKTSDPKIIKITGKTSGDWRAEVFTLSSKAWKNVPMNLPYKSICFPLSQIVIDGVIYWIAYDLVTNNGGFRRYQLISFDLTREEFGERDLPDSCLADPKASPLISKRKDSLVLLKHVYEHDLVKIWIMKKNGDPKFSFTNFYTIGFRASNDRMLDKVVGFRKNGQPITQHFWERGNDHAVKTLEVCEPCTKDNDGRFIVMNSYYSFFKVTSYKESLLLLNHSADSIIHC